MCARVMPEIGRAAVSVHGWPHKPLPRALTLHPVLVARSSALVESVLWKMSKRARKKIKTCADARATSARRPYVTPARAMCLLLCIYVIMDLQHHVCQFFRLFPVLYVYCAGACRRNQVFTLKSQKIRCDLTSVQI